MGQYQVTFFFGDESDADEDDADGGAGDPNERPASQAPMSIPIANNITVVPHEERKTGFLSGDFSGDADMGAPGLRAVKNRYYLFVILRTCILRTNRGDAVEGRVRAF